MNLAVLGSAVFQVEVANYHFAGGNVSSLQVPNRQVRVQSPNSVWIQDLKERFNELTSLPRGWDGYDGRPVAFDCAQFAAHLIESLFLRTVRAPQLVPGADGTLQIEWHMNGFDVEIDVLAPYSIVATRFDHVTDVEEEIEIQTDFSELAVWIEALGAQRGGLQQIGA